MPWYDYHCRTCETTVEIYHTINDESDRLCEKCNSKMNKVLGASVIELKGGGWGVSGYTKKPVQKGNSDG